MVKSRNGISEELESSKHVECTIIFLNCSVWYSSFRFKFHAIQIF